MIQYLLTFFLCLFINTTFVSLNAQQETTHDIPIIHDGDNPESALKSYEESDNFQGKFFNMLFVLALLVAFMIIASMMLKRMTRQRVLNMNTQSLIKILETRPISPRATLYLINIEGKDLLIAESQAGLNHIATFDEPKE